MNKNEHSHFHGYQDKKDAYDEKLDEISSRIYGELWSDPDVIAEAISASLVESNDYLAIVKCCYKGNSSTLLGAVTLELISSRLSVLADEMAEDEAS